MLSNQLKELAADGLVERIDYNEVPPRVEYRLTPNGEALMPIFDDIQDYIRKKYLQELLRPGYKAGLLRIVYGRGKVPHRGDHDAQACSSFGGGSSFGGVRRGGGPPTGPSPAQKRSCRGTVCRRHRSGGAGRLCLLWSGYGRLQPESAQAAAALVEYLSRADISAETVTDWQGRAGRAAAGAACLELGRHPVQRPSDLRGPG